MKCRACDVILTDAEATAKDEDNRYIELCDICLSMSTGQYYDLKDGDNELLPWEDFEDTFEYLERDYG